MFSSFMPTKIEVPKRSPKPVVVIREKVNLKNTDVSSGFNYVL